MTSTHSITSSARACSQARPARLDFDLDTSALVNRISLPRAPNSGNARVPENVIRDMLNLTGFPNAAKRFAGTSRPSVQLLRAAQKPFREW